MRGDLDRHHRGILASEYSSIEIIEADLPGRRKPTFCVIGAGHGGLAMAGYLAIQGFSVKLYNRSEERLQSIWMLGGIQVEGEISGFGSISIATTDIEEAIDGVDVVMVVIPATGHRSIAEKCAPYLKPNQIIVLNPGRTGGALEFKRTLMENGVDVPVIVAEAQTFIFASRVTGPGQVKIFCIKNSIPVAALPAYLTPTVLNFIRIAFPQFVPGDNVLKTSFDNIGAVFHPALAILNSAWIEETHGDFEFYLQGASPSVASVLEALDQERVNVAAALGIRALKAREWLYLAYDAVGNDLYTALHANPGYRGIRAPNRLTHRYIREDVPMSLVPLASIGDMLGVPTPTSKSIIHLANIIHNIDYWAEGRTVDKLGIMGLSVREIRLLAVDGLMSISRTLSELPMITDKFYDNKAIYQLPDYDEEVNIA
ncbi:MAG: NAD/NADP octopine/nopaline dehydrogenase family protein [Candidatus Poribacteria bacterium]